MIKICSMAPDSILRRMPALVGPSIRLRADLQLHCHDVMVNALNRLRMMCMLVNSSKLAPGDLATMFADAWSIVDQVDLVRQVLKTIPGPNAPVTTAFLEEAEAARKMRNSMDHISQRIPNIAAKKGACGPMFGNLSFVKCKPEVLKIAEIGEKIQCEFINIARGTVPGLKIETSGTFSTYDVNEPISNIRLQTEGHSIRLDWMCVQLTDILYGLEEGFNESLKKSISEMVQETGLTAQQVGMPTPITMLNNIAIFIPYGPKNDSSEEV